jgi:hydrogenase maturation protein HypF
MVHGTVQGVGFRPFVYRLATSLGLDGWVRNAGGHVVVEAAGAPTELDLLTQRLRTDAPPLAVVTRVNSIELSGPPVPGGSGFAVNESRPTGRTERDLPPDVATCADCLAELFDPADRRFRYPFINCTNCGPRATIIGGLPYDRERTTMATFRLCTDCAAEYTDPTNRRFHAEPVACPACGPRLSWRETEGLPGSSALTGEAALRHATARIAAGEIVAVKGLGGYQLICDATRPDTVARLRTLKRRPAKPFAIMVPGLPATRRLAWPTHAEEHLLTSIARPIVLIRARRRGQPRLATGIHPSSNWVGIFLPYTPLHHLLLGELDRPLVVTSGNRAEEPIAIDDTAALRQLGDLVDGFLYHDRPILARYDDSVTRVVGRTESVVRRARGYAPAPLAVPVPASRPLLAVGAQLKHTFAIVSGDRAVLGPHGGDLEDADTMDAFTSTLDHLCGLLGTEPELVAHDLHPGYLSTQYATGHWPAGRRVAVQHHHAHVASCAAEHGVTGPVIGVAYDGLGLGDDGTLWGGEILLATLTGYRRLARFATAPLPGGAAAIRRPARMALGYLFGAEPLGSQPLPADLVRTFADRKDPGEVQAVRRMIERSVNSPRASSAGRLFDAVASLLGLRDTATYEGEAAVALEAMAGTDRPAELPWRLARWGEGWVYDVVPTLRAVLAGQVEGRPESELAAAFHQTIVAVTVALCEQAVRATGVRTVCLSGGCFQNQRLATEVPVALRSAGLRVLINRRVPVNDGGISYGQAAIAAARTAGA